MCNRERLTAPLQERRRRAMGMVHLSCLSEARVRGRRLHRAGSISVGSRRNRQLELLRDVDGTLEHELR